MLVLKFDTHCSPAAKVSFCPPHFVQSGEPSPLHQILNNFCSSDSNQAKVYSLDRAEQSGSNSITFIENGSQLQKLLTKNKWGGLPTSCKVGRPPHFRHLIESFSMSFHSFRVRIEQFDSPKCDL
jgi:hypothetical protein